MEHEHLITKDKIYDLYEDHILNHGERPKNMYRFAKDNHFEEKEIYEHFASFEQIERSILESLFSKSVDLANEVNNTNELTSKEKLLNVYFIFLKT